MVISSVSKAFTLLNAFSHGRSNLSLSDLTEITGLNKSSVQRLLHTLEKLDLLTKHEKKKTYSLAPKNIDFGYNYLKQNPIIEIASPRLLDLSNKINESISLSIQDGRDIVYVIRIPRKGQVLNTMLLWRRVPVYCSSGGRVFLAARSDESIRAFLTQQTLLPRKELTITDPDRIFAEIKAAQTQGFAICDQECLLGEIAISTPIHDSLGNTVAALHVSLNSQQWPKEKIIQDLVPSLLETARAITPPTQ
ncbi:IclR family transcriptional regulator [Vibrio diabolicus]|uniref:Helix-turn-helix domain-containing protein n=1 Tax=Vibrio diabolicus TaxID=50719 RepID=A0AA92LPL2_9VIBR|nr:IclR family transcriptional regulator C-terminal domain-containing protein [Vibrio diabolicus]QRG81513.1 helix-turn-helix domain-containing protein [Vibrio diabolicus]